VSGRTVHDEGTDRPKLLPEPPVLHREKRSVCDGPADCPPRHRPSGTLVRTVRKLHAPKIHRQKDQKKDAQELARTRRTAGLSGTSRTVRGDLADGPRIPRGRSTKWESAQPRNSRNNLKLPIDGSPKPHGVLRRNFGR
jgi:hypothetical protein